MMVFVGGTSRSGKTSTLSRLALKSQGVSVLRGSALLRKLGRPITRLRLKEALENQNILADWVKQNISATAKIVFDGHLVVPTLDGPLLVPDSFMSAITLCGLVVIADSARAVFSRRSWKSYPVSVNAARYMAELEDIQAKRLAEVFDVAYVRVSSQSVVGLKSAIRRMLEG